MVNNKHTDTNDDLQFSQLFIKYFLVNQKEWYKEKIDAEDLCTPWYNCAKMLIDLSAENLELSYYNDNSYLEYLRVSWIIPYSDTIKEVITKLKE